MSVKSEVLLKLEENKGSFFSGEELAINIGVSRAAVWKAIKQLETEGYKIKAVPNKGYCLFERTDIISAEGIKAFLPIDKKNINITVFKETASTNIDAKQAAISGCIHGTTFVAESQNAGRGRRGRNFLSFDGSGIYMSMVLKPDVDMSNIVYITTAASVAVARAIYKVTNIETGIKWVNDIYYNGKKICGILTEAVTDCETGIIDSLVVGIGINFNVDKNNIPSELKDTVGALYNGVNCDVTRNELIAHIIDELLNICGDLKDHTFIKEYKTRSIIIGCDINVIKNDNEKTAKAIGIDDRGGLIVRYEDNSTEVLSTGEVTIRKIN